MAHTRDFESILPDPKPYIEQALALHERAIREQRGRVVFVAAELGGGKTDLLNALAQSLHHTKPEPNFVAGFFRGGEYFRQTLNWQDKFCIKRATLALGETASLLGLFPGLYAFAVSFIGQLIQAGVSIHEFGSAFKKQPQPGKETADWLRDLLRRTTKEKPLVCLLDDWDEAQRFYWDSMLQSFSREIALELPLLMFLTVKEPINLSAPEEDKSGLSGVIKILTEKGLAEFWQLGKLTRNEVANYIGPSAPGVAAKLHAVTGGNAGWVQELWREWRLNEIVVLSELDDWIWAPEHSPTLNLYDDILRRRLAGLINADTAMRVEQLREVLACAALEGMVFTADAVARTLEWDRDELIDLLDDRLVQSDTNPDGILLEEGGIQISAPDGPTKTFWRYSFVSELHWLALERYGFANEERPNKTQTEKLEMTDRLTGALIDLYGPEARLVAPALARLLRTLGRNEIAEHYQRTSNYGAERELMREHALRLVNIDKDDWGQLECGRSALFLIEAGGAMFDVFAYSETLAVAEEAQKLAHRANHIETEARALFLSGTILHAGGEINLASDRALQSLNLYRSIGKKRSTARVLLLLAFIDYHKGKFAEARKLARESLRINRNFNNRQGAGNSLHLLADIDYEEKNYEHAKDLATEALTHFRDIGDRLAEARSLTLLSQIACIENNYAESRQLAMAALEIKEELGDRNGVAMCLHVLANTALAQGQYQNAYVHTIQALRIDQELGNRHALAISLKALSEIADKFQQPTEAMVLMSLGGLILREIGHADWLSFQIKLMGMVRLEHYVDQIDEINRQVTDAYRQDGGNELIESALERLSKIEM